MHRITSMRFENGMSRVTKDAQGRAPTYQPGVHSMSTSNRTAIVTGSSRGIGAEIATRLASDGFNVVVNYTGAAASAEGIVAQIKSGGGHAIVAKADVADAAAVSAMFGAAEKALGGVDILVNC